MGEHCCFVCGSRNGVSACLWHCPLQNGPYRCSTVTEAFHPVAYSTIPLDPKLAYAGHDIYTVRYGIANREQWVAMNQQEQELLGVSFDVKRGLYKARIFFEGHERYMGRWDLSERFLLSSRSYCSQMTQGSRDPDRKRFPPNLALSACETSSPDRDRPMGPWRHTVQYILWGHVLFGSEHTTPANL